MRLFKERDWGGEEVLVDRLVPVQPFVASISPAHEASLVSHYISFIHFNTPLALQTTGWVGCDCILSDVCVVTLLQSQRQQQFSNKRSAGDEFGGEMVRKIKTAGSRSHFQQSSSDQTSELCSV